MPSKRILLFLFVLLLLAAFLWAAVNIDRQVEIANYTTSLEGRSKMQIDNLKLASARVNDVVLKQGEIFSFNRIVGERLRRWGYKGAPTILNGKMVDTPGGGLCQLTSTIYNAALYGGMEIIERTPHLWTINSVGPGRDAAILYSDNGSIDLKFRNNYSFPVKITCEIRESRAIVRLFAPRKLNEQITVDVDVLQVLPPPRYPDYLDETGREVDIPPEGKYGYKVRVFRYFRINDKLVKKEPISTDRYEPVPGRLR